MRGTKDFAKTRLAYDFVSYLRQPKLQIALQAELVLFVKTAIDMPINFTKVTKSKALERSQGWI